MAVLIPNILLLTGSIDPRVSNTPMTVLNNPQERLKQYTDNITKLIKYSDFDVILFCENTNYQFDYSAFIKMAAEHKKIFEAIVFKGNAEKIERSGKGFGEGEIIKYAIENSSYLLPATVFYKLTGRLFVDNINELILKNSRKETIFIKFKFDKPMVDTRFFKSSVSFFQNTLLSSYESVNDFDGYYLEMVYYDVLKNKANIHVFSDYPNIKGVSGSTGLNYDLGWFKLAAYRVLLKLGFLTVK